jgi:NTP pyrophosphatase (non-canonical NTP hydrolase)
MTESAYESLGEQVYRKLPWDGGALAEMAGRNLQAIVLAEETGEAIRAYRRATGQGRTQGTWAEVAEELADVIISAQVLAAMFNIDLDKAVGTKLAKVVKRGIK